MLYKVNEKEWVSLRAIDSVTIRLNSDNTYYLEITVNGWGMFTDSFKTVSEVKKEILNIQKLMEESVL